MKNFKIFFVLTKHHLDLEPDVSSACLPTNLKRSTYYVDKYRAPVAVVNEPICISGLTAVNCLL
jgi:hypothetical protein